MLLIAAMHRVKFYSYTEINHTAVPLVSSSLTHSEPTGIIECIVENIFGTCYSITCMLFQLS